MTNPLRLVVAAFAAAALPASATAGWDNVFQVACWDCKAKPSTSYYAAPAPPRCAEKRVELNVERAKQWVANGAQLTDKVAVLYREAAKTATAA